MLSGRTHDRRVRERLHGCHADECGNIRIGNIELISMSLKIASNKRVSFMVHSLDVFEPPGTRGLLDKDAV